MFFVGSVLVGRKGVAYLKRRFFKGREHQQGRDRDRYTTHRRPWLPLPPDSFLAFFAESRPETTSSKARR